MDAHAYYEASHHIHFLARKFQTTTTFNTKREFPSQSASNEHFVRFGVLTGVTKNQRPRARDSILFAL
ncbi:hypothetical protein F441_12553 [Phytophthora nicotianae CJ01A1]|uniref:Uncharacterized protein n=1 Tax=Phytophthora nicotianae CJ01A1 TaxID=1317063 RepID=W2WR22_PHYNI|nr:hypothetical protein F441_12553 [Phytophthora nicotianae CJ01A1]